MQVLRFWARLKSRRIDKRDLTIAILVVFIIALIYFGWNYFKTKKDPFAISVPGSSYRYLFSMYNPQNLKRPLAVAVSPWGDVVVADSVNHRLVLFDRNGQFKKTLGGPGSGPGQFHYPTGVAVCGDKIYVADFYNQRVQVVDFEGRQIGTLPRDTDRKQLGPAIMPITLAVDSKDNVYVSDLSSQRILRFDSAGKLNLIFGKAGSNQGELSYVNGIAIDEKQKKIFLANSNNARVEEYTLEGKFSKTLCGKKDLTNPKGVAFNTANNRIYVVDTLAHQVLGISPDGGVFDIIGKRSLEADGFNFPTGIAVDGDGRLYVADRENNRVQVYAK